MGVTIEPADMSDLQDILQLQYLAYTSEADLFEDRNIPPLTQTLDEVISEYNEGMILKAVDTDGNIIGSVRTKGKDGTIYIGKLMVHPDHRNRGYGTILLKKIEELFPDKRYELFTSTRSESNIRLYQSIGYDPYKYEKVSDELTFVFMEK